MTREPADTPIRIAITVGDPDLADRLAAILSNAPGLRLTGAGETADVEIRATDTPVAAGSGGLTPREREVLALMAAGDSNKEIARRLGISAHTAKFHVGSVLDKLDATGRVDAVAHASRLGILRL